MSELLIAENVTKTFQRKVGGPIAVLDGVSFEVYAGDKIAILGKSGAGKSTLLHILGTLEKPTHGEIQFLGKDIFSYNEDQLSEFRNREIGFVFQFHYLMVEFTALENVLIPGLLAGKTAAESAQRARQLLERVGLRDRLHHKPGQLSGGEQQRIAIARALMMQPKLLLTDEMTGNLDPATGHQIFQLLEEIHEEFDVALVSVTHDEVLAQTYQKIYRLDRGKLRREK
jgi:lipoprotein-releasing system ATP-binding protein